MSDVWQFSVYNRPQKNSLKSMDRDSPDKDGRYLDMSCGEQLVTHQTI